jgi:hypothetical protein
VACTYFRGTGYEDVAVHTVLERRRQHIALACVTALCAGIAFGAHNPAGATPCTIAPAASWPGTPVPACPASTSTTRQEARRHRIGSAHSDQPTEKEAPVPKKPRKPPLLTLPILKGSHELAITRLRHGEDSFTLRYRITPPLPESGNGALVLPVLEALDDLGNEYDDRGGAYGTHLDGIHTDGSLTAQPSLHPDASSLRLRITWLESGKETSYDIALDLRH